MATTWPISTRSASLYVTATIWNDDVAGGLNYLYNNGVQRLAAYGATSVTNSTTETTLATTSVSAGIMSTNRALRFTSFVTIATDAGGTRNVNFRVKFGGTTHLSGNMAFGANQTFYVRIEVWVINTTASAQKILGSMMASSTAGAATWTAVTTADVALAGATGAINTASAQTFAVSAQQDTAAVGFTTSLTAGELELV